MSSEAVHYIALMFSLLSLAWVSGARLWHIRKRDSLINSLIESRLIKSTESSVSSKSNYFVDRLQTLKLRANLQMRGRHYWILATALVGILLSIVIVQGILAALITLMLIILFGHLYLNIRFQKLRTHIYNELPVLIDTVLRYLESGQSLEQSLSLAFKDSSQVFSLLKFRLLSAVDAGRNYNNLFEDYAALYKVPELVLISIALRTASRFGSNVEPLLKQVSETIRSRQELRREFLAATSETRFTAISFSVLPPGLALYVTMMNEEYGEILFHTSAGQQLLVIAGLLQALGMLIIWRMIHGVGRE